MQAPDPSLPPSLAEDVTASKANKRVLLEGAAAFNLKPKVGLKFLEEHGIIYNDPSVPRAESLARFFKTTPRLDKRLLGDFISRPDQLDVLRAFMQLMDFEGVRPLLFTSVSRSNSELRTDPFSRPLARPQKIICDAMRELLEAFRLPGESQQIARITETFAEVYFATEPPEIRSQDATYVLSYSVIMLNTDQHNSQVRKRMDLEAYARNLRGVNDGKDFDPEYLVRRLFLPLLSARARQRRADFSLSPARRARSSTRSASARSSCPRSIRTRSGSSTAGRSSFVGRAVAVRPSLPLS